MIMQGENSSYVPIASSPDIALIEEELLRHRSEMLFEIEPLECYLFSYEQIPNLMKEIAIRREEAFRAVGEGTGKELDTDSFDSYYKHLVLWNKSTKSLVGAYRIGLGREIMEQHGGMRGFYITTLFNFKEEFSPVLADTIELGRSFVSLSHQKDTIALLLLIKGILYVTIKYPEYKYLLGPVSISSWYPMRYRSLMVYYLRKYHNSPQYSPMVSAKSPFETDFGGENPEELLAGKSTNLEMFDRFLLRQSENKYRLPSLLKKYLKLGAKIIEFNVDPDFNYCVDGLIMLTLSDVAVDDIDSLTKEFEDRAPIYRRFYGV